MRVYNPGTVAIPVPLKGEPKDGQPPYDSVLPGETKELALDPENQTVKGILFAGALVEVGAKKTAKE
jgi:hypothetical protein